MCKCYEALCHEKIKTTTKVLIIAFKRKNHTYKGDIGFNLHFSMSNYVNQKENIYKKNYKLKAIISYSLVDYYKIGKKPKYFADININDNWYRFTDFNEPGSKRLKHKYELYRFEPQILIYELESDDPVFINPFSNLAANQNGNYNVYQLYQIMEMQKKGLQKKNLKKSMKEIIN